MDRDIILGHDIDTNEIVSIEFDFRPLHVWYEDTKKLNWKSFLAKAPKRPASPKFNEIYRHSDKGLLCYPRVVWDFTHERLVVGLREQSTAKFWIAPYDTFVKNFTFDSLDSDPASTEIAEMA